jgi:hypothetical protein
VYSPAISRHSNYPWDTSNQKVDVMICVAQAAASVAPEALGRQPTFSRLKSSSQTSRRCSAVVLSFSPRASYRATPGSRPGR